MHTCGFYPVPDLHHGSQLVLAWGSNNTATNEEGEIGIRLWDRIRAGAKLIVVDPRKTDLASRADYWLQIRPGTDSALALAFLNVIIGEGLYDHDFVGEWAHGFDELSAHVADYTPEWAAGVTWVPPDLIRAAARAYARTRPASILWGNALEQTAGTFDALRGLVSLMAVCGNLDVPGGNVRANEPKLLGLGPFTKTELIPDKRKEMIHSHHGAIPRLMTVPPAYFRQAVLEGRPYPVRGAYVQCANPLVGYADSRRTHEALRTLDFLAVADVFMTPTAAMADIVLPAATHFEFNDLIHYGLGHGIVLACPKIVDPPHDCRPDLWTLNELGRHLTPAEYWYEDYEELVNEVLAPSGLDFAGFAARGFLAGPERYRKYESSGFKTPSGKVELVLSRAEKYKLPPLPGFNGPLVEEDPEYPLTLISSKNRFYLHSSYRWVQRLRSRSPEPVVEIHPDTAARHGIEDGDEVIIATRSGCITQIGRLTADIHPRVINAAYGWWFPEGSAEKQYDWGKGQFQYSDIGRSVGTGVWNAQSKRHWLPYRTQGIVKPLHKKETAGPGSGGRRGNVEGCWITKFVLVGSFG